MNPVLVKRKFEERDVRRVKVAAVDLDGLLRGKWISVEKFWSAVDSDLGFCDVIFGWDIADVLYDNVRFTGWHTGYPDARARLDLSTFRLIPWEPHSAFFLLDILKPDGAPLSIAPRNVLRRALDKAASMEFAPFFAAEYELFFFRETPESLRQKNFRNLTPLSPGMFGYSVLRASAHSAFLTEALEMLAAFNVPLEGLHTETGPGVYEAAINVAEGLAGADRAVLFKSAIKEISARHGLIPTFMAKWNADLPGSGGHIHQSLWDSSRGANVFFQESGETTELLGHYVAGLVANLPELMVMMCPTINSFKRTVPGVWAPVNATWGVENRTTAVRVIPAGSKSTRVELRLPGADLNPYLAMAASLAAGLDGIERKLEAPPPSINAYAGDAPALPRNLAEATHLFRKSELARKTFGDEFVEHYAATRDWEVRQFEKAVTDWELARYFESI